MFKAAPFFLFIIVYNENQWGPMLFCTSLTSIMNKNIRSVKKKKVIKVLNDMRVSK